MIMSIHDAFLSFTISLHAACEVVMSSTVTDTEEMETKAEAPVFRTCLHWINSIFTPKVGNPILILVLRQAN